MKFLVDAHLPIWLCGVLRVAGHDAVHTSQLPEGNRTVDGLLIRLAMDQGRILVSKDTDFFYAHLVLEGSFRLLLIRTGNIRTARLIELVGRHLDEILTALGTHSLVELHSEGFRVLR